MSGTLDPPRDKWRAGAPDWCPPHEVRRLNAEGGEAEGGVAAKAERSLVPSKPGDLHRVIVSSETVASVAMRVIVRK